MCYKVIFHSLRCDVRPVISCGGLKDIVSSYTPPIPCSCEPDPSIVPWLRCADHGCCRITTRLDRCDAPNPCPVPRPYHIYERAESSTVLWVKLDVLDGHFAADRTPKTYESPEWGEALNRLMVAGEQLKEAEDLMRRIREEIEVMELVHFLEHGECWFCSSVNKIAEYRLIEAEYAQEMLFLIEDWDYLASVVELGGLEGQRNICFGNFYVLN